MGEHVGHVSPPHIQAMLDILEDGKLHRFKEFGNLMVAYGRQAAQAKPTLDFYASKGKVAQYGRGLYGKPGLGDNAEIFNPEHTGKVQCPCCLGVGVVDPSVGSAYALSSASRAT